MGEGRIPVSSGNATTAQGDLQAIEHFEMPQRRHDRAFLDDAIQDGEARGIFLILEIPCKSHRTVDDQAHGRPSLIRSLMLRPPSVTPLRRAMMLAAA